MAIQREKGLLNVAPKSYKTNGEIIKENVFTLFNLLNFLIGICLALVTGATYICIYQL